MRGDGGEVLERLDGLLAALRIARPQGGREDLLQQRRLALGGRLEHAQVAPRHAVARQLGDRADDLALGLVVVADVPAPAQTGRGGRARRPSVSVRDAGVWYTLEDVIEQTRADQALVKELEEYGVIKGQQRSGVQYFDETEREIIRAVTELARYGVGGRNLRVFRTSADREAQLLQTILAPALRSRNPERRKEAIEALENLAAVASHLKHLLLIRDLRKVVG